MVSKSWSASIKGIDADCVFIEAKNLGYGDLILQVIGMADTAIKESRSRVNSALQSCGIKLEPGTTIISLSPADEKKSGALYDLPIALALSTLGKKIMQTSLDGILSVGELCLDGKIQSIRGILPIALHARKKNAKALIVPLGNVKEASMIEGLRVFGAANLLDAIEIVKNQQNMTPEPYTNICSLYQKEDYLFDFSDVKGQAIAKRGMEIAAAGFHNIILIGSPGCGKSMLSKRLPSILPPLSFDEALETTKIHSIGGLLPVENPFITIRPFRSPHHTISDVGLLGGGQNIRPGEVTFANNGVLFLDEFPEFKRSALEVMRQPLEDGKVTITRATGTNTFPAKFLLVAAMNPCPCGYLGSAKTVCKCTEMQRLAYKRRISGPLLDRIDLHIQMQELSDSEILQRKKGESSAEIYDRVGKAREIQKARFLGTKINFNSQMGTAELNKFCELTPTTLAMLKTAINNLQLTARAYDRILRVARTIADLNGSENVEPNHISEAIQFRTFDRQNNF